MSIITCLTFPSLGFGGRCEPRSTPPSVSDRAGVINKNPYPDAPLNQRSFPQILDQVLTYPESWLPLWSTSKALKKRVEALMYSKIIIRARNL